MERLFLLSEVPAGVGRQLIQSITNHSQPVIAFAKDCEDLQNLSEEFPSVIGIVLDIRRDANTVAQFLRVLPSPNYIVNDSGPGFLNIGVQVLTSGQYAYKVRERGRSELTFDGIVDEGGTEECKIVNVVERRSQLDKTPKRLTKLVKGVKTKLNNLTQDDDDSSTEDNENQPLLANDGGNADPPQQGFFLSLIAACCPCILTLLSDPEYSEIQTPEELYLRMKFEQIKEIRKVFRKLHADSISRWRKAHGNLENTETRRIEELTVRVSDVQEREEKDLTSVKEAQNETTRKNLSEGSSAYLVDRIEKTRIRQAKATAKHNADQSFREGKAQILEKISREKAQMQNQHYLTLVEEQLQKLTEIKRKYQEKGETLRLRYFANRV